MFDDLRKNAIEKHLMVVCNNLFLPHFFVIEELFSNDETLHREGCQSSASYDLWLKAES